MIRQFAFLLIMISSARAADLKVISYNVFNGFNYGKSNELAAGWLREQSPDIVAFQELNKITTADLGRMSESWGHPHAIVLKENGWPVGITSRHPIELVSRNIEGFWHGYLHVRTAGYDLLVVHLHSGDWKFRLKESAMIKPLIKQLLKENRKLLVLGDFNSHSSADSAFLAQRPAFRDQLGAKNLDDGKIDFSVMESFFTLGLVDPTTDSGPVNRTYPTLILGNSKTSELQDPLLNRIDFILTDPVTSKRTIINYPTDPVLDRISDHYPVVAIIKPEAVKP